MRCYAFWQSALFFRFPPIGVVPALCHRQADHKCGSFSDKSRKSLFFRTFFVAQAARRPDNDRCSSHLSQETPMNHLLIYASIFFFGVSAGLVLSYIVANRGIHPMRRRNPWFG
jgi:hypothetical protein